MEGAPLSRPAIDLLSSPVGENSVNSDGLYAIEPSETFWKQFPSLLNGYSSEIVLHATCGQVESNGTSSLVAARLADEAVPSIGATTSADSPRSPLLTTRSKMGSLSSMSMRSKSSTLSSTKSDSSMLSITNGRSSSSTPTVTASPSNNNSSSNSSGGGGGAAYTATNLNNSHTLSITTRTPKAGRKTPKKNNGNSGETEKMIRIKCQRLREEDRTYEEVEIEVPAPVYETMQAYTENGGGGAAGAASIARKLAAEKRGGGLGTKIKCLFSKTAS